MNPGVETAYPDGSDPLRTAQAIRGCLAYLMEDAAAIGATSVIRLLHQAIAELDRHIARFQQRLH